tara:strand:- start:5127 stop:5474 length:348 start_codon:yes stop_codon:yes gene_type:complete
MINDMAKRLAMGGEVPFTFIGKTGGLQATLNDDGMVTSYQKWGGGTTSAILCGEPQTVKQTALEIFVTFAAETSERPDAWKYEKLRQEMHNYMETPEAKRIWPTYIRENYFNEEE